MVQDGGLTPGHHICCLISGKEEQQKRPLSYFSPHPEGYFQVVVPNTSTSTSPNLVPWPHLATREVGK